MDPSKQFIVKKKHPFLKKGIIIYLIPHVYGYFVEDGNKGLKIPQAAIEYWTNSKFIKLIK